MEDRALRTCVRSSVCRCVVLRQAYEAFRRVLNSRPPNFASVSRTAGPISTEDRKNELSLAVVAVCILFP